MPGQNLEVVRRWFEEVWNQRRGETVDELVPPESVCHTDEGPLRGPGEFKERQFVPFLAAFPDLRVEVEAAIEQGDEVVVRWVAIGTHDGEGLGCRATRRRASFRGISWICVRDGKFVEGWQSSNIAGVVRDLMEAAPA